LPINKKLVSDTAWFDFTFSQLAVDVNLGRFGKDFNGLKCLRLYIDK